MLFINGAIIAFILVIISTLLFSFFTNFVLWFIEIVIKVFFTLIEVLKLKK